MDPIKQKGLEAIHSAIQSAARHSETITRSFRPPAENEKPVEDDETIAAMTGLKQDERQVKAAVKIIKASEEMDDAILDILA